MMHSGFGTYTAEALPPSLPCDAFLDNSYTTTQMAFTQVAPRLPRGSAGQRAGTAMRVVKPTSANNSPRSSAIMARRRTMAHDGQTTRRQQQAVEYMSTTHGIDATQAQRQQSRPVSWHPSTHLPPAEPLYFQPGQQQHKQQQHHQQQQQHQQPTYNMYIEQQDLYSAAPHYSPMMGSYSNDTSPCSTFSPLPTTYQSLDPMANLSTDNWQPSERSTSFFPALTDSQYLADSCSTLNGGTTEKVPSDTLDWNNFILHGFRNTSPLTPDSFVQTTQQPPPVLSEASIQLLDEPEEEGEILVGMGLYDDKYQEDPHLNNYRSTVSSLLGFTFQPQEAKGKGLKLEETWEPPKSEDEDEDEEQDDED